MPGPNKGGYNHQTQWGLGYHPQQESPPHWSSIASLLAPKPASGMQQPLSTGPTILGTCWRGLSTTHADSNSLVTQGFDHILVTHSRADLVTYPTPLALVCHNTAKTGTCSVLLGTISLGHKQSYDSTHTHTQSHQLRIFRVANTYTSHPTSLSCTFLVSYTLSDP